MHQDRRRAWARAVLVVLAVAALLVVVAPVTLAQSQPGNASADAQKFMTDAGSALAGLGAGTVNPAAPVFGVLLGALIVTLGALSIWLELLLRSAAIYISVLFLPLALAAMIWPAGWRWCRRLIEFLIAIIFAKVFIVAIINLAAAGLARGGLGDKFEGVLAGGALLLMAAFTPVALLKLIPLAEAAVVTAGHQRAALRQATQGATALTTSSSVVSGMIQTRFRASSAAGPGQHRRQRRRHRRRHQAAEAARPVRRRAEAGCVAPWRSATASGRWSGAAGSGRCARAS